MNIQGQSAIVTGGGSGLGEAVARELARLGAKVAVLDVNAAGAQRVASEVGGISCACDITDTASVTAALDAAQAAHGVPRIVMNIAGIGSANRPGRMHVLAEPPAIDKGEVTDKGSINQRAVLATRAALVEALYEGGESDPFLILPKR